MRLELILTELQPFRLSHFGQLFLQCRVWPCAINSSYSFQWLFLKIAWMLIYKAPIMTAADDIHKYFFIVSQRK